MESTEVDELAKELAALLTRQRRHRGNDGILRSTLESVLALYEERARGTSQAHLEALASCVCSSNLLELLTTALVQCEEYPSMQHGSEIASLCVKIVALVVDTERGAKAVTDSELTRSSAVRWMVIDKMGERYFGPGLRERMERYIPSEEECRRLCPS